MNEFSLDSYILWLNQHPALILGSLLLMAFVESLAIAGIIVPGVAILFAIAVVAGGAGIPVLMALSAAMIGAVMGDVLSFYLGRHYSDRLTSMWPFSRYPDAIESGSRFFHRYGGYSVVIGRFVGPIRPILPLVAGALGMRPVRFVSINVLSAIAWAPAYVLPGYLVGAAVNISPPAHWPILLGGMAICLLLLALVFRHASRQLQEGQSWYAFLHSRGWISVLSELEKPYASWLLLIISLGSVCLWTWLSLYTPHLEFVNTLWLEFALSFEVDLLRKAFIFITALGDELFLQISFTIAVITLLISRQTAACLLLVFSGLTTSLLTHGMKAFFEIPRPDVFVLPLDSFAYPSGHSSGAMVLYGLIATLVAERITPHSRWRIYLLFFIPAMLIGLSRVVLGAHWFSDVVAGLLIGAAICAAARIAYWYIHRRSMCNAPVTTIGQRRVRLYGLMAWLISLGLYQYWMWEQQVLKYALLN
ncbi:MAG: phosphoesterase [Oleiphilus sp.]|nr:MAG: phosphoesterase [Oleiphilus sp.]